VLSGVKPTSKTDALALVHDINYLIATSNPDKMALADNIAINNAPYNTQGIAMKAGLTLRKWLHIKESEGADDPNFYINRGYYLKSIIINNPYWREVFNDVGHTFLA